MPSPNRCPNCDSEAPAAFCPACGQRQLGRLTFVPLMAAILRLVLWSRANFAECVVIALHVIGHVMLLTAITGQVFVRISPLLHGYVSYGIYIAYSILTLAGTFGWSVRSVLAGLLGVSVAGIAFMLSIATLTGYVLTHWIP